MRVAAENFIGAFAGEYDLVASVATARLKRYLATPWALTQNVSDCRIASAKWSARSPAGWDGIELGASFRCHFPRFFAFVVFGAIEGEGEGANRIGMMLCGEAEDGAGVQAAAEIATDGNISAQAEPDGFFEDLAELVGVVGVERRGIAIGPWVVKSQ